MATESIRVVVRCRPPNKRETEEKRTRIVEMDTKMGTIWVKNPNARANEEQKTFTFDAVFDWNSTQRNVYDETVYPIVECVLGGYNGTVFAYGQTGTGKSHTMTGVPTDKELKGVIPNAFEHIFDKLSTESRESQKTHLVRASYLEIYNEEIRDLLGKDPEKKLELKENPDSGVYVKDLSTFVVNTIPEIEHWMDIGNQNRHVSATKMNATSSRSHSIFSITVETSEPGPTGEPKIKAGKLHLVDLAGSERQSKTEAEGQTLKEAAKINLSLSALGNVISALVDGKSQHVPYRDSKLTRLLQNSLGGNSKTVMIAAIGPADHNFDETVSTLRYANRAKNIKNKPKVNEDPKDTMIRQFQEEIARLKAQLESGGVPLSGPVEQVEVVEEIEGVDPELYNQLKTQKEEEVMQILSAKGMVEEERKRVAEQLREIQEKQRKEKEEKEDLQNKLQAMQDKLLVGGRNLLDEYQQQQQQLRIQAQELEQKAIAEKNMKRELARMQEEVSQQEDKYSSLQEEVESKTKKLKKVWTKIQAIKSEVQDKQEEWQSEKEDMLDTLRELTKQLKLKMLMINNFIPPEELARIERRAEWDQELGEWRIVNVELAGNNMRKQRNELGMLEQESNKKETIYSSASMPNVYFSYTPQREAAPAPAATRERRDSGPQKVRDAWGSSSPSMGRKA